MITIKGINKNNELEYELIGGKLQHANQLIITDTTNQNIIYDKTIDTFATCHKIPSDLLEDGKTYKLLLLALDENNNFIDEADYYIPTSFKPVPVMKLQTEKDAGDIKINTYVKQILGKIPTEMELIEKYYSKCPSITGINTNKMKMRIKYFEGATKLQKITKGNWIDVYANKDVFVPVGERAMIPLGFALELPQGWEAHLAPRSSTFKTWGIIQTNHVGVVDDSYIGDNDQWHMPVYCLQGKDSVPNIDTNKMFPFQGEIEGTWINKGDKLGQFRIMEVMPEIEFEEVASFGNADRGGFGTTGVK